MKNLHVLTWKEDKLYVAKFLELELASQGKTKNDALKNLQEALELYLEDEDLSHLKLPSVKEVSTQTFVVQNLSNGLLAMTLICLVLCF